MSKQELLVKHTSNIVEALVCGATMEDVAQQLKIDVKDLNLFLMQPAISAKMLQAAKNRARSFGPVMVNELINQFTDPNATPRTRFDITKTLGKFSDLSLSGAPIVEREVDDVESIEDPDELDRILANEEKKIAKLNAQKAKALNKRANAAKPVIDVFEGMDD